MALAHRHYHHRLALLLFAAPKLPAMARSLGQSMRIIKSEVKEMKNDGKHRRQGRTPDPVEGKIVNHPQSRPRTVTQAGTGQTAPTFRRRTAPNLQWH